MNIDRRLWYAVVFVVALAVLATAVWVLGITKRTDTAGERSGGVFSSLFPFGRSSTTNSDVTEREPGDTTPQAVPALRQVSVEPVAGAQFIRGDRGILYIRYIERNTGHIYETPADAVTTVRRTNTTIPAVHDAQWLSASSTLMRFLNENEEIQNFVGVVSSTTEDQELAGTFIRPYLKVVALPKQTILGILQTDAGAVVETATLDGTQVKPLYTSQLFSWVPHASAGKYYLASAPSGFSEGALYEIVSGTLTRVVQPQFGFQALMQTNGPLVAVTSGTQNVMDVRVYNLKGGAPVSVPVGTVTQKCSWGATATSSLVCAVPRELPRGLYPDDWLLGYIHTVDDIYAIDPETGALERIVHLTDAGEGDFDVTQLSVSDTGEYVLFVNRNDLTLWSAKIQKSE